MTIVEYGENINSRPALVLGRFESLHLGHRALIDEAKSLGRPVMLMLLKEEIPAPAVLNFGERVDRAAALGADFALKIPFTDSFRKTSAEDFLMSIFRTVSPSALVFGSDFRFGRDRQGDGALIKNFSAAHGIITREVKKVKCGGEEISTTRIKSLLKTGDAEEASRLLGYDYFVTGAVVEGRKVGRSLGFPTANVVWPDDKAKIAEGVYIASATVKGRKYYAVTNVGAAPTFGVQTNLCESYLDGFSGDIYGENITVSFLKRVRSQTRFESEAALIARLRADVEQLKQYKISMEDKL